MDLNNFKFTKRMNVKDQIDNTISEGCTRVLQALAKTMLDNNSVVCHCDYSNFVQKTLGQFFYESLETIRDEVDKDTSDIEESIHKAMDGISKHADEQYTLMHEREITVAFQNGGSWQAKPFAIYGCVEESTLLSSTYFLTSWLISYYKTENASEISAYLRDGANSHKMTRESHFGAYSIRLKKDFGEAAFAFMSYYALTRYDKFLFSVAGYSGVPSTPAMFASPSYFNPNVGRPQIPLLTGGRRMRQLYDKLQMDKAGSETSMNYQRLADLFPTTFKEYEKIYESKIRPHLKPDANGNTPNAMEVVDMEFVFYNDKKSGDKFTKKSIYKIIAELYNLLSNSADKSGAVKEKLCIYFHDHCPQLNAKVESIERNVSTDRSGILQH